MLRHFGAGQRYREDSQYYRTAVCTQQGFAYFPLLVTHDYLERLSAAQVQKLRRSSQELGI